MTTGSRVIDRMPHAAQGATVDSREDLHQTILDNLGDGVYYCDRDRVIRYWNAGAERITGYSSEQVLGSKCADGILAHIDEQGTSLCKHGCPVSATLDDGVPREARVYLHHLQGHRVPVLVRTNPVHGATGEVEGVIETFSDGSALLDALRRVDELSAATETDPLTGIGNRRYMEAYLDTAVGEKRRSKVSKGVLFIDIDLFKDVNDTYGHEIGDRLLRMVAQTLNHNLRSTDLLARWGGEEFLVLLDNIDRRSLAAMAEKLRVLVAHSHIEVDGAELRVTVSLGATLVRPDDTRESLLARADALLYRSKNEGRDRVTLEL